MDKLFYLKERCLLYDKKTGNFYTSPQKYKIGDVVYCFGLHFEIMKDVIIGQSESGLTCYTEDPKHLSDGHMWDDISKNKRKFKKHLLQRIIDNFTDNGKKPDKLKEAKSYYREVICHAGL